MMNSDKQLVNRVKDHPQEAQAQFASLRSFCKGTRIVSKRGNMRVEDLMKDELILTLDHGYRAIRQIRYQCFSAFDLQVNPKLRAINISAGTLGRNLPDEDLIVSPDHRVMVRSRIAEQMFNESEVLVTANTLLRLDGVCVLENDQPVEYYQVVFDTHQIVFSNGAPSESSCAASNSLKPFDSELEAGATDPRNVPTGEGLNSRPARHVPNTGKLALKLVEQHQAKDKPLLEKL